MAWNLINKFCQGSLPFLTQCAIFWNHNSFYVSNCLSTYSLFYTETGWFFFFFFLAEYILLVLSVLFNPLFLPVKFFVRFWLSSTIFIFLPFHVTLCHSWAGSFNGRIRCWLDEGQGHNTGTLNWRLLPQLTSVYFVFGSSKMWCLILCGNLTGIRDAQIAGKTLFWGYVWRVFLGGIGIWISKVSKDLTHPCGWASSNLLSI